MRAQGVVGLRSRIMTQILPDLSGFTMPVVPFHINRGRSLGHSRSLLGVPAAAVALMPGVAVAHAIVVAAQPAMNSTVAPGEIEIRLQLQ